VYGPFDNEAGTPIAAGDLRGKVSVSDVRPPAGG
jgi:hypothetical protein